MAAVLLLVGQGLEEPDIVARMLDLSTFPCKPQYAMAPEVGVAVAPA
jgi:tRNA pseudouridine38/39 synthase